MCSIILKMVTIWSQFLKNCSNLPIQKQLYLASLLRLALALQPSLQYSRRDVVPTFLTSSGIRFPPTINRIEYVITF
jgi:hypothetical protein